MASLIALFKTKVTKLNTSVIFVLTQAVYVSIILFTIPSVVKESPATKLFDMSPLGYTFEEAVLILTQIGESGRSTYVSLHIPVDFLYPLLFAICYASILTLLLRSLCSSSKLWFILYIPMIAGISDYIENIGTIVMVNYFPDIPSIVVSISSFFTIMKSLSTVICFSIIFICLIVISVKSIHRVLTKTSS